MHLKHKLIGASAVLAAFAGIGTATALAQSPATSPTPKAPVLASVTVKASEPKSATDTDKVQQGDQNGPDLTGTETPDPADATASAKSETTAAETPNTNEAETGKASDGPGGHTDPPGNVDHQFDGQE